MWRNALILIVCIGIGAFITYALDFSGMQMKRGTAMQGGDQEPAKPKATFVPDFSFKTLDGQDFEIKDFRGKSIVLNFWASWCAPCVKEFPHFLKLAQNYPEEVVFIGLSSDHKEEDMNRFLSKMAYEHPEAMDADNVLIALDENTKITRDIFQTFRLPETIIIDKRGRMRDKLIGADWTYEELEALMQGLPR